MADYEKINWVNYPTKTTAITADRLNHMDDQIYANQQAIKKIPLTVQNGKLCIVVEED